MSQLDLIAELRANRPAAPPELRARVLELAASVPAPRRRFTWRRALVVAVAVAGLAALAGALMPRGSERQVTEQDGDRIAAAPPDQVYSAATGSAADAQKALTTGAGAARAPG